MKKFLLGAYGEMRGLFGLASFLTFIALMILGVVITAIVGSGWKIFLTILIIGAPIFIIVVPIMVYILGRIFIARSYEYGYYKIVETMNEKVTAFGDYMWKRRGYKYDDIRINVDQSIRHMIEIPFNDSLKAHIEISLIAHRISSEDDPSLYEELLSLGNPLEKIIIAVDEAFKKKEIVDVLNRAYDTQDYALIQVQIMKLISVDNPYKTVDVSMEFKAIGVKKILSH